MYDWIIPLVTLLFGTNTALYFWNRHSINNLHKKLIHIMDTSPKMSNKINEIVTILGNEIDTISQHDIDISEQKQLLIKQEDNINNVVTKLESCIKLQDKRITCLEKKISVLLSCKRKINSIEKNFSASIESCGVQIAGLSEQIVAMEEVYHHQLNELLETVKHLQLATTYVSDHLESTTINDSRNNISHMEEVLSIPISHTLEQE